MVISQDESVDGPTGEYRKEMVKKVERKKEADTNDTYASNESVTPE